MTTVKFSASDKLKELQSRLYLLTKQEFTQQQILELSVALISENIELILAKIEPGFKKFNKEEIENVKKLSTDWGEGTEDSSQIIDDILYG